jgi:lambda family phage portal protein
MSWFNKQIARVFPGYALKREIALRRFERLKNFKSSRSFDALSGSRLRYDFLSTSKSADAAIKNDVDGLRQHVRQLEYNNGHVSGPIRRLTNNVVGAGIRFQSRVTPDSNNMFFPKINATMAGDFNRATERLFSFWSKISDVRLMQNFYELQATVCSALERDNEVLSILRISERPSRRDISPLCVEVLEADRLQTPMSEISNPAIRNGVEYDEEGVPELYYILKVHPGESLTMALNRNDYDQVDAFNPNGTRKVLHLFRPVRPEQTRGYSMWASALKDIQDMDRIHEAEVMATLEDACMTGTIVTENPVGFANAFTTPNTEEDSGDTGYDRIHEFGPNQMLYLNPGEKLEVHRNARPNPQMAEFEKQLLKGPSNALDMPPEVYLQDFQGMNYSNARTVLLMFYLSCRIRQQFIIDHFCAPVYEALARDFIARGKIQATGFDRRPHDYLKHSWIPPGWQWVDPVKEAKGKEIEVDNFFETLSDLHASKGNDFEETMERRAREIKFMAELEEKYGIEFPQKKAAAGPGVEDDDDGAGEGEGGEKEIRIVK